MLRHRGKYALLASPLPATSPPPSVRILFISNPFWILARECVQERQTCSVGGRPTGVKVRSLLAWVVSVEKTKRMKPTDKAILGMVSKSPGRNASEPTSGLETK